MRVMMLTPDVDIDRRILQEAATLVEECGEVLVVAMQTKDRRYPDYETQDGIKIQRFFFDGTDVRVLPWVPVRNSLARQLHLMVTRAQARLGRVGLASAADIEDPIGERRSSVARIGSALERIGRGVRGGVAANVDLSGRQGQRIARILLLPARMNALALVGLGRMIARASLASSLLSRAGRRMLVLAHRLLGRLVPGLNEAFRRFLRLWSEVASRLTGLSAYEYALYRTCRAYPYDVYHAHDLPMLKVARRLARRWNARLVYDAHELYPEIITLSPEQRRRLTRLERREIRRSHAVITVNHFIADEMARRYRIPVPHVIHNCAPTPPDGIGRERLFHDRLGLSPDQTVVLYQGWLAPNRGLEPLVASARHLPDRIVLVLLGFGDYWADLEQLIESEGVKDRVFLVPAVPQEQLLRWTAAADAGIVPYQAVDLNTRYCSPNKLFEYIVAGVPVIVNDLPFLREVVTTYGIGEPYALSDARSYSEAIRRLVDDQRHLDRCRMNTARAAEVFNWRREAEELLTIYRSIGLSVSPSLQHAIATLPEANGNQGAS